MDMDAATLRNKVLAEIKLIPEDRLAELYGFVHDFRLGLQPTEESVHQIMRFAGSWSDMPEPEFVQFTEEVMERRRQAFSGRRSDEASID
jgi:hypothetical protein